MIKEERCCGSCCYFKHEDIEGWGICYHEPHGFCDGCRLCSEQPCEHYVSDGEYRHHIAVLIQANRYRRDNHVPAVYRMPDPFELGKAIDFAVSYMKKFERI